MINFSIVLIARNEEKTLPRLLNSLIEFQERGGEIILVDTGSMDNTAQIAAQNKCVVVSVGDKFRKQLSLRDVHLINEKFVVDGEESVVKIYDSMFDYASARNYAASLSSNDFICMPDCDEIFTAFDIDKIGEAIKNTDQLEYNFVFSHDADGKPLIQFLHSKFYDRRKLKWNGIIHEILQGNAKRTFLDESIIKLEHFQNVETNRSGYLKGLAYDCFLHPEKDRQSHYFAREMMYTGRFRSAIKEFERHIAMNAWQTERAQSMLFIGDCHLHLGDKDEAIKWYLKSFDLEPNRREPLMKLAELSHKENKLTQCVAYCEAALTIKGDNFYANYQPYYSYVPHELLYFCYWWTGEKEKSKEHFDIAFEMYPTNQKFINERVFYYENMVEEKLPVVHIIIPHINGTRKEGLKRCHDSIRKLLYPKKLISVSIVHGDETVPIKVNHSVKENPVSDYYCFAANDMTFDVNSIRIAIKESISLNKGLVSFNEGPLLPDNGNICTHFIISRKLVEEIGGQIFDERFSHVGCDNDLWNKCSKLNQAHHSTEAKITHNHFSKGFPMDEVYEKGWKNVEKDRALLKEILG